MTERIYLHTNLVDGEDWRVIPALLIRELTGGVAKAVYVTFDGAIRVDPVRHLLNQLTGEFWVYAHQFEMLAKHVEEDYQQRRLWHNAYADVQRIRQERTWEAV